MGNTASQINPNAQASGSMYQVGVGPSAGLFPLLEQKIAVLAEGNTDNQTEIGQDGGMLIPLTSKEVGDIAGYGSPAHLAAIMLFDNLGVDVGVKFFFVPEAVGGTVTTWTLTGTGATVTKTGTLVLNINGVFVSTTLVLDDTLAEALVKIKAAINAEINLPCEVNTATPTTSIAITSKWKGQSSAELFISVYSSTITGITFAEVLVAGTGEVNVHVVTVAPEASGTKKNFTPTSTPILSKSITAAICAGLP